MDMDNNHETIDFRIVYHETLAATVSGQDKTFRTSFT